MVRYIVLLIVPLLLNCGSTSKEAEAEITALEATLAQEPSQEILLKLLSLYQQQVGETSGEERLQYLWKTGETARAVKSYPLAEKTFEEIYKKFPEHDLASKAMFLHAFMCDEDLQQFDKAKALYASFLEKYPDSDFNDDAQFLLANIGKSDEEMLEMLSKQAQEE